MVDHTETSGLIPNGASTDLNLSDHNTLSRSRSQSVDSFTSAPGDPQPEEMTPQTIMESPSSPSSSGGKLPLLPSDSPAPPSRPNDRSTQSPLPMGDGGQARLGESEASEPSPAGSEIKERIQDELVREITPQDDPQEHGSELDAEKKQGQMLGSDALSDISATDNLSNLEVDGGGLDKPRHSSIPIESGEADSAHQPPQEESNKMTQPLKDSSGRSDGEISQIQDRALSSQSNGQDSSGQRMDGISNSPENSVKGSSSKDDYELNKAPPPSELPSHTSTPVGDIIEISAKKATNLVLHDIDAALVALQNTDKLHLGFLKRMAKTDVELEQDYDEARKAIAVRRTDRSICDPSSKYGAMWNPDWKAKWAGKVEKRGKSGPWNQEMVLHLPEGRDSPEWVYPFEIVTKLDENKTVDFTDFVVHNIEDYVHREPGEPVVPDYVTKNLRVDPPFEPARVAPFTKRMAINSKDKKRPSQVTSQPSKKKSLSAPGNRPDATPEEAAESIASDEVIVIEVGTTGRTSFKKQDGRPASKTAVAQSLPVSIGQEVVYPDWELSRSNFLERYQKAKVITDYYTEMRLVRYLQAVRRTEDYLHAAKTVLYLKSADALASLKEPTKQLVCSLADDELISRLTDSYSSFLSIAPLKSPYADIRHFTETLLSILEELSQDDSPLTGINPMHILMHHDKFRHRTGWSLLVDEYNDLMKEDGGFYAEVLIGMDTLGTNPPVSPRWVDFKEVSVAAYKLWRSLAWMNSDVSVDNTTPVNKKKLMSDKAARDPTPTVEDIKVESFVALLAGHLSSISPNDGKVLLRTFDGMSVREGIKTLVAMARSPTTSTGPDHPKVKQDTTSTLSSEEVSLAKDWKLEGLSREALMQLVLRLLNASLGAKSYIESALPPL